MLLSTTTSRDWYSHGFNRTWRLQITGFVWTGWKLCRHEARKVLL